MKHWSMLITLGLVLLLAFPSCYIINFEEEIEVEMTFDASSSRGEINVSHLVDVNEYSADFRNYRDNIDEIELISMTCWLNKISEASSQYLTEGTLVIADENGDGAEVLAILPKVTLEHLYMAEQELILQEPGRQRVEELILSPPNTCLGRFTGKVDELPSNFIITFHIKAVIRGSLL